MNLSKIKYKEVAENYLEELVKEGNKLSSKIQYPLSSNLGSASIPGFDEKYTGSAELGCGVGVNGSTWDDRVFNTACTAYQFVMALVYSKHPLIKYIMSDESIKRSNFEPEPLVEAKILEGTKILDLGCGLVPSYARCCRGLGAKVYTVDVIPVKHFIGMEKLSKEYRDEELKNHIQVDLNKKESIKKINSISDGNFDIVSCANLDYGTFYQGNLRHLNTSFRNGIENSIISLIKEGGIFYRFENHYRDKICFKHDNEFLASCELRWLNFGQS